MNIFFNANPAKLAVTVLCAVGLTTFSLNAAAEEAADAHAGHHSGHHAGQDMGQMASPAQTTYSTAGIVHTIDRQAGQVKLTHEPIPELKWPKMTMRFVVEDPAVLERMKEGARIEFDFVQTGKGYLITGVRE
jgi:Cu(I)/Ag(I) efflux system protein CusF